MLSLLAADWEEANRIREFCNKIESETQYGQLDHLTEATEKWLEWANVVATIKDPFKNGKLAEAITSTGHDSALDCTLNSNQVNFPLPDDLQTRVESILNGSED